MVSFVTRHASTRREGRPTEGRETVHGHNVACGRWEQEGKKKEKKIISPSSTQFDGKGKHRFVFSSRPLSLSLSLSLSVGSWPPLRPPGVAGDTAAPTTKTRGTASMRCASAPASAREAGAESSASLPPTPKVAAAGLLADPAAAASSSSSQQQQPPQPVFCRICLDSETEGLIAPCQCRGKGVHETSPRGRVRMRLPIAHLFSLLLVSFSLACPLPGLSLTSLYHATTPLDMPATFNPNKTKKRNKQQTGTQQYVHVACLRKWQSVAGKRDGDGEHREFFLLPLLRWNARVAPLLVCFLIFFFGSTTSPRDALRPGPERMRRNGASRPVRGAAS